MSQATTSRYRMLLGAFVVTLAGFCFSRPETLATVFGVNHYGVWFLDTFAILASNDAWERGRDVYAYNPLDYFGRPHVYPHAWLALGRLGLTRDDAFWLGATVVGLFLVAAWWRLKPRTPGELVWSLAVLCSPPVLLAMDRGNNDLVVFLLLAPVVPLLLARRPAARFCAIPLILLAAVLKTYPAIAGLLLIHGDDGREVRRRLVAAGLVFLVWSVDAIRDLAHYGGLVPKPDGLMTFGASQIFALFGCDGALASGLSLVAGVALAIWLWWRNDLAEWSPEPAAREAWLSFILGATLLTGCFFAGRNYGYRWIFAVWMVPLLWTVATGAGGSRAASVLGRIGMALLLMLLWLDGLASAALGRWVQELGLERVVRWADVLVFVGQPLAWAFFGVMLVFLTKFLRLETRYWRMWARALSSDAGAV